MNGKIILKYIMDQYYLQDLILAKQNIKCLDEKLAYNDIQINKLFEEDETGWFNDRNPSGVKSLCLQNKDINQKIDVLKKKINFINSVIDILDS